MTTCFCGCGRQFGFTKRAQRKASDRGAQIADLLPAVQTHYKPWLDQGRPGFEVLPPVGQEEVTPEAQYLEFVRDGEHFRLCCVSVAHGELDAGSVNWKESKSWCFIAKQFVDIALMPIEARRRIAQALHRGSAEEIMQAFEDGAKLVARGQ